ncbi:MAG: TIGR04255 family protein [Candidatus Thiodiazotropha sp. (ex Codakia orbicularis)]|nr:TIGR04255 family protein [Candidatus Thiodiazotropha sp. (ex Codakia orbicularis)]
MPLDLPKKLKEDAIVEAVLEVRFESNDIGEVVVGRLTDLGNWKGFNFQSLPNADIPDIIRVNDPRLKFVPTVEGRSDRYAVRIGARVISYHVYEPYPGWRDLQHDLNSIIHEIYNRLTDLRVTRLGLRYINLINSKRHNLTDISQLELNINVAGRNIQQGINLAFGQQKSEYHLVMTRVASPEFISGTELSKDVVCAIDVDVFTNDDFKEEREEAVQRWVSEAHNYEKEAFFQLLPDDLITELAEE